MIDRRLLWLAGGLVAAGALIVGVPNAVVLIGAGTAGHDAARAPRAGVRCKRHPVQASGAPD
jgi:hypothetical protein